MSRGKEAVLAIDQGTSGTKAIVVDPIDGVVALSEVSVRPSYLPGGGVEQDPAELLESVISAGKQAAAAGGRPIGTVALANQGETVLNWDLTSGEPAGPAISWQDSRATEVCLEMAADRDWIARRTGLVLDSYFSAPKMAWLRRHRGTGGVITTTDTWLIHQLTGEFVTDVSTASRSLLLDLDSTAWDEELAQAFGLAGERLPRIVDCDVNVGRTDAFGSPMTVGGLIVDQQAALLAQGAWQPGQAKCTFGTGAFLLANTGRDAPRSTAGLTTSVAWRIAGDTQYCIDGQVLTAGAAVRWMVGLGLVRSVDAVDEAAAHDAGAVLCVPALAGLAAPWWRSEAGASFTGMSLSTGPGELVLAVLQGIAAQVAAVVSCVAADLSSSMTALSVDGGLTGSAVLMQAVADLTQLPVEVYPYAHATALGAAALGRLAGGSAASLSDCVLPWSATTSYQPIWSADRAQSFLKRWGSAVEATGERAS